MYGKGKKREERDQASDGYISTQKKFPKKDSDDDDPKVIVACEISDKKRVTVRNSKGKIMVDVHEFYVKDGKKMHGTKGISLEMDEWKVLRDHLEEIELAVKENF